MENNHPYNMHYPLVCTRFASHYELGKNAPSVIERDRGEVSMIVTNESVGNLFPFPDVTAFELVASGIRVILAPAFSERFLATASELKLLCIIANKSESMTLLLKILYSRNAKQDINEGTELYYLPTPIAVDLQKNLLTLDDKTAIGFYAPIGHLPQIFRS